MRFTRKAFLLTLLAFCFLFLITSSLLWLRTAPPSPTTTHEEPQIVTATEKRPKVKVRELFNDMQEVIPAEQPKKKITTPKPIPTKKPKIEEDDVVENPIVPVPTKKVVENPTIPTENEQKKPSDSKLPTIFVSIASFRDAHCSQTLNDLIATAEHLDRIYVGIVQQNAVVDPDCVSINNIDTMKDADTKHIEKFIKFRSHIRVKRYPHTDAKGPVWAREIISSQLYQDEDFYFQIDSHSRFVPNWDTKLIENYNKLPKKSVITHYPSDYDHKRNTFPKDYLVDVARICTGFYNSDKILQPKAAVETNKKKDYTRVSMFIAAGMAFYPGYAHKEVPLDPYLPQLFHGEELSFSVRMAAKGWKFYAPQENTVFHYYYRKNHPKFWDTAEKDPNYDRDTRRSLQRVKYMLRMIKKDKVEAAEETLKDLDMYGINWNDPKEKANVEAYFKKFKIDLVKKQVGDFC